MDQAEILAFITEVETEDIDPMGVAKVFAATIEEMQSRISKQDMQRLMLAGAAMFRNSVNTMHAEMQLPPRPVFEDAQNFLESARFKGVLH